MTDVIAGGAREAYLFPLRKNPADYCKLGTHPAMRFKQRCSSLRTALASYLRPRKLQAIKTPAASKEHRIFHVTELLEAILHELPIKDLLLVIRVCKTWKKTIDAFSKLQQSLFFLAEADPRRLQGDNPHGHSGKRRLLAKCFLESR